MATNKPKKTQADKLEENIRLAGLEAQITQLVNDVQNIELNALWRATAAGKEDAEKTEAYTPEELEKVLEKQEANRVRLRAKADLLKDIYNKRLNT